MQAPYRQSELQSEASNVNLGHRNLPPEKNVCYILHHFGWHEHECQLGTQTDGSLPNCTLHPPGRHNMTVGARNSMAL